MSEHPIREPQKHRMIYLSCWINHWCICQIGYGDITLAEAIANMKNHVDHTMHSNGVTSDVWEDHEDGMVPHIYAGEQKKWVWMNRVSLEDRIPFTHRTVGVTTELKIDGIRVFWRKPKHRPRESDGDVEYIYIKKP